MGREGGTAFLLPGRLAQRWRRAEAEPVRFGDHGHQRLTAAAGRDGPGSDDGQGVGEPLQSARFGADHDWKLGGQIESGEHSSLGIVPTGVRYIDRNGTPSQSFTQATSNGGGRFTTVALFITDALTPGDRLTINAGLRFDRTHASSPDVDVRDAAGRDTGAIVRGLGPLYR